MPFFVYILKFSVDGRFYYGQTNNFEKRLAVHNSGKSKYTMKYIPWRLFAFKECSSRVEAMKIERMLKNLHHQIKVAAFVLKHEFTISGS
jgi:putative endonuclease